MKTAGYSGRFLCESVKQFLQRSDLRRVCPETHFLPQSIVPDLVYKARLILCCVRHHFNIVVERI